MSDCSSSIKETRSLPHGAELIEEPEDGEDVNHHPATENLIPPKAFMLNGGNEMVLFSIGDLNTEQRSRLHYRRLGCPNLKDLQKASKEKTCKGLKVSSRLAVDDDPCVIQGRFKSAPFRSGPTTRLDCFHTMSTDGVSGFACATIGGAKSAFITVDYESNWPFVHLVKTRDEFPMVLADLNMQIPALGPYELRRLRSDSAPELQAGEARRMCASAGILLEPTGVNCPKAGGKHESMVYSVCVRARTFQMMAPWMPPRTWGLALLWAEKVLRVTPIWRHGTFASPHERVTGMKPDLCHMCIHVWGCVVSYGLTKAERMTTEHKKLSALTMEFYFGGMSGNMVLLVHQDTFVVYQGNAQKCHFYEGIFTERTPPKQSNPLGLLQDHVDNYVDALKAQGLVDTGDSGEESEGMRVVQSAQNLKPVGDIYEKIKDNFKDIRIGDMPVFEGESEDAPAKAVVEGTVADHSVQFLDDSFAQLITDLKIPQQTSDEAEDSREGIVTRQRASGSPVELQNPMPARATDEEMKSKKASWTGITLAHPQDGTTAVVTEVSQRKVRGQDKWCWWLTLLWSDGFVKQYNEGTLCQTLKLTVPTWSSDQSAMARPTISIEEMTEPVETVTESDAAAPPPTRRNKRPRRNDSESEPAPTRRKTRSGQTFCARFLLMFMSALNAVETPALAECGGCSDIPKPKFTLPPRGEKDPKSAFECLSADDWKGWIWAARTERKSWRQLDVYKVVRKRDRDPRIWQVIQTRGVRGPARQL